MISLHNQIFNFDTRRVRLLILNKTCHVVTDSAMLVLVLLLSYLLRFEFEIPPEYWLQISILMLAAVPLQLAVLHAWGVNRQIWRYISLPEARRILSALFFSWVILLLAKILLFRFFRLESFPLSIMVFDFCFSFFGLAGIRVIRRLIYERNHRTKTLLHDKAKKPVLLIGAGRAGVKVLAEIKARGDLDFEVKGFVDDDPLKQKATINGVRVLGTTREIPALVKKLEIDHVVISIAQTSRENIRRIYRLCEEIGMRVKTIPGMHELLLGRVTISRIRDVRIEDLLGRPPIDLNRNEVAAFLQDKVIMVTGAGGSIGSELVRQIADCSPRKIVLIERCEYALFQIEQELLSGHDDIKSKAIKIEPILADICNERRMQALFREFRPAVVFHAAAHKHVPLTEQNPAEALANNILGTNRVARLAGEFKAESFVLISTDKAVNPTSVMGATKRVAELIVQNLNQKYETRFMAVRFGNVIGSTGSVIPTFRRQIQAGGPVTVTHPEMERYFMTIPEATQLVLQAGAMGEGGEIMILDMGKPVKILDLALEVIRLSGLTPYEDIDIVFTGIRPGEKLVEELECQSERLTKTRHPKIFIGEIAPYPETEVAEALNRIRWLIANAAGGEEIKNYLVELLPEARFEQPRFEVPDSQIVTPAQEIETSAATMLPNLIASPNLSGARTVFS